MRRWQGLVVASALLGATACGSTVQTSTTVPAEALGTSQGAVEGAPQANGEVQDVPAGTASGPSDPVGELAGSDASGGGTPTQKRRTTTRSRPASPTTAASAAADGPPAGASGATRSGVIKVGVPHVDAQQASAFTASFGGNLATGDDKRNFQILLDDLNARGGILGRKVVPHFHTIDINQQQAVYEQAACTDFTQDNRVAFVLVGQSPTLADCLIRRGVGVVGDGSQLNTADYDKIPYYVQSGSYALDRLALLQAREFTKMGLFKGTVPAKVGILYYDLPTYRFAEKVLAKELRALGVEVVVEEAFAYAASVDALAGSQAQVQNAVLKFRSRGVTHVVGVELNAFLQGFFALYGSQQDYYPRYGWTSNQVPTNVKEVAPDRALVGSLVLGFYPMFDTEDQSTYPAETRACFTLLKSKGVPIGSGNQRSSAAVACDAVRYLKAALTSGGGVDRDALVRGARQLGSSFKPAVTFASLLPKGYGAGAAALRRGAWNTDCDCFRYTSAAYNVG